MSPVKNIPAAGLLAGALLCVAAGLFDREAFFEAYLVSYVYCLGIPLGALGILFIHALTGGEWGRPLAAPLDALVASLRIAALLFLPLFIYFLAYQPWIPAFIPGREKILEVYLNRPFWAARSLIYFVAWIGFAEAFRRKRRQGRALEGLSAGGLLVLIFTISFAMVDWIMVLSPGWHSAIFGLIHSAGCALSGFAFVALLYHACSARDDFENRWSHAKLLVTMIVLLLYLSYAQYLVTWMANIAEDAVWYVPRTLQGWKWLALFLLLFYFALPFLSLLFEGRRRNVMVTAAALLLICRYLELVWQVAPEFNTGALTRVLFLCGFAVIFCGGWLWWLGRSARDALAGETP